MMRRREQHEQAHATLRMAWKLEAGEGIRKLEQLYASWLEREWPSAGGEPARGSLGDAHGWLSRWRNEAMAVRWAAVTFRETEKRFRRILGYQHLRMLKAHFDEEDDALAETRKVG